MKFLNCTALRLVVFLSLGGLPFFCVAQEAPTYYQHHASGWFWYQTKLIGLAGSTPKKLLATDKKPKQAKQNLQTIAAQYKALNTIANPVKRMHALQRLVKRHLDAAILVPTPAHVKQYVWLQNKISQQASRFGQTWRAVLLNAPHLNFNLAHPTSRWANLATIKQGQQKNNTAIQHFARSHGLFFFYRGTCPHCRHFAPIVKAFATRYHVPIIAVSLDGIVLPQFPHSRRDAGQAKRLHVQEVPALFAVDPKNQQIIALGYGDRSLDQLRQDVLTAIRFQQRKKGTP